MSTSKLSDNETLNTSKEAEALTTPKADNKNKNKNEKEKYLKKSLTIPSSAVKTKGKVFKINQTSTKMPKSVMKAHKKAISAQKTNLTQNSQEAELIKSKMRNSLSPAQMDERPCMGGAITSESYTDENELLDDYISRYALQDEDITQQENSIPKTPENIRSTPSSPSRLLNKRATIEDVEMSEDNNEFIFPKKTVPLQKLIAEKASETTRTANRYQPISDEDTSDEEPAQTANRSEQRKKERTQIRKQHNSNSNPSTSKENVPPIVIQGIISNINQFKINLLNECNVKQITIKYTRYSTLLHLNNIVDYKKTLDYMKKENANNTFFHTYTLGVEKTHAFVIRGLDHKPSIPEVTKALRDEYELEIIKAYEMRSPGRPLYMIITSSAITLKYLQSVVKHLMCVRVFIEIRNNNRKIIQCHRCQQWGHATSNCFRRPRCVRCAGNHLTKDCEKHTTGQVVIKCVNCDGKHQANNIECKSYLRKIGELENRQPNKTLANKKAYTDAPLPSNNAWKERPKGDKGPTIKRKMTQAPELTQKDFPVLKSKNTTEKSKPTDNNAHRDIATGRELAKKLESLINIKEANRAMADLVERLEGLDTREEKFVAYYEFLKTIDDEYEI